jgi:hypothetical protein
MPETQLPAGFDDLGVWVADWALATQTQREHKRLSSPSTEMKAFYDAMMLRIEAILDEVDKFPIGGLPEAHKRLFNLALSLTEVAPNVELYKGDIRVVNNFDERRFYARHGNQAAADGMHDH